MHPWNEPHLESMRKRMQRLPHALLIHGVRGVGKLALAERIAQLLLCEEEKKPCGSCPGCRWFLAGTHPDFSRIEPEALAKEPPPAEEGAAEAPAKRAKPSIEIKVDQIRGLEDFLNIGSHRGKLRVALVHPAEDMNEVSANALLKGLDKERFDYSEKERIEGLRKSREFLAKEVQENAPKTQSQQAAAATEEPPNRYFRMMKELALLGYFTSQIGCTQALVYEEAPGKYEPCIPYKPGQKAYADHA